MRWEREADSEGCLQSPASSMRPAAATVRTAIGDRVSPGARLLAPVAWRRSIIVFCGCVWRSRQYIVQAARAHTTYLHYYTTTHIIHNLIISHISCVRPCVAVVSCMRACGTCVAWCVAAAAAAGGGRAAKLGPRGRPVGAARGRRALCWSFSFSFLAEWSALCLLFLLSFTSAFGRSPAAPRARARARSLAAAGVLQFRGRRSARTQASAAAGPAPPARLAHTQRQGLA
jgi:hypothetical protein